MLLVGTVACVLYVPSVRSMAIDKGLVIAREQTGMDIEVGRLYLSPFHHSPMAFYHAYKGEADLPVEVRIDSLFVGHRGQDTLACIRTLRLKAVARTAGSRDLIANGQLPALPIEVEQLLLDETTFHSDSLIPTVGVDVILSHLAATSPGLNIGRGTYPLHGLQIYDTYVGIDLRAVPDAAAQTTPPPPPPPLAFDVPDGDLRNIHFALTPVNLNIFTRSLQTNALIDVGGNTYDARRIEIGGAKLTIGDFALPIDSLYGDAAVSLNNQRITSHGLHVRSDELGARADLTATEMNLGTMRVEVTGDADFRGSKAQLRGAYSINDEAYDLHAVVERVNLAPFLKDSTRIVIAGEIDAKGKGFNPRSKAMRSHVQMHLTEAVYDRIEVSGLRLDATLANRAVEGTLHLPFAMRNDSLRVSALTDHQFRVAEFMTPDRMGVDYRTQMREVKARVGGESFYAQQLDLLFTTDTATALHIESQGFTTDVTTPMHVLRLVDRIQPLLRAVNDSSRIAAITSLDDLNQLDTLRRLIPELHANIALAHGSPAQRALDKRGLDIDRIGLVLNSDAAQTNLAVDVSLPDINHPEDSTALRLPAAKAAMRLAMEEGSTRASLTADSKLTDGAMMLHGLKTDADLWLTVERAGSDVNGVGQLTLDSLSFAQMDLGSRTVYLTLSPSEMYPKALRADVQLDDIPLEIVDSIIHVQDLDLSGAVRAQASVDGLPRRFDLSAEVLPLQVAAKYKPYEVQLGLGETPIVMNHNKVDFNGLPIYGADSTYLALTGGLDLNSMRLDITLAADSFAPVKLEKDGPIPVYGDLATDIRGTVTGALDSIVADVDITILPTTDITYPIDQKNLAQVKPYGTVHVRYEMAEDTLLLGGDVHVDDGFIRYSPKAYPIMPFHVDSGSHVAFNGPVGQTLLDISASQHVKASTQSDGEGSRMVDFITGVRVNGVVDSIGLNSISFFLEAPEDEEVSEELASVDEETREGLAATLLATGMYLGESNVSAHEEGYALTSIINSRINAAMVNSKRGKIVDIDVSSGMTQRATGETNDLNIAISKSFFQDRLRLSMGASLSDNPEAYKNAGFLNNISAEYKLTKDGMVLLRAFGQRDYNNILEGELIKSGLGVRTTKDWNREKVLNHKSQIINDTIYRIYNLTVDADVAYRSNNSLGPNLTLTHSIKNLLGNGETFTVKGNGAYYWALTGRHPGDPKKTDTYKLGASASLVFPYLHWTGNNNPDGDTRYMLGYQYENIAGGYGVHKLTGSFTYFIRSSKYITHAFTPFSLSIVMMKAESDSLMDKAAEFPQLIKVLMGDEFVPAVGYSFIYNDYRSKRAVNTMLELGVKESGNLINGVYCAFGHRWDEPDKHIGNFTFNQFVKLTFELRNKFNLTDQVSFATRLYAGANIPTGSSGTPLSEAFYAGGTNSMRGASPYSYGPGNFYSDKYNQNFFHAGDVKLEANAELRFPIVWKLYGAAFVDAGNVWNWVSTTELFAAAGITNLKERMQLRGVLYDGIFDNPYLLQQIALGTGAGLRLDLDGLVIRLDLGVAIHAPYQTYRRNKSYEVDYTQPINTYFNIPTALDALRLNFGIGYPF